MASAPVKIFAFAVVLTAVAGGAYQFSRHGSSPSPAFTGPPPNARYVDEGPDGVIAAVLAGRPGQREQARDFYYGRWVPSSGWLGVVANVEQERRRTVVRLHYPAASALAEYWVIAHVAGSAAVSPGDRVLVQGMISEVDSRVVVGNVVTKLVLDPAAVTKP